jgi:hypothetical protein
MGYPWKTGIFTSCACNDTNLTRYLSSVYWVTLPLTYFGFAGSQSSGGSNVYIFENSYVL